MWKRIKHWWQAEGDLAQLQGVSNRMLEDMGLDREELRASVMGEATAPVAMSCSCRPVGGLVRG